MKNISAQGRVKVKGSMTPNYDHKFEQVGARIMRELHSTGHVTVYTNSSIARTICLELVRVGIATKSCDLGGYWLLERVGIINYEPKIGSKR